MIRIELPLRTTRGLNDRMHWSRRARLTKHQRATVAMITRTHMAKAGMSRASCISQMDGWNATVTLTRLSAGTLDDDNLQGSLKACRDGVADALEVADNDYRVRWLYVQEKCKRGAYGIRVEIA